jgi:hypothetical protein
MNINKIKKKLIVHIVTQAVISLAAVCAVVAGLLWLGWMWFFFFPDDQDLTAQQAAVAGEAGPSRILVKDLVREIDSLRLDGPCAESVIAEYGADLVKAGRLVKSEEYSTAAKRFILFRAGTGRSGVWVDEPQFDHAGAGCVSGDFCGARTARTASRNRFFGL